MTRSYNFSAGPATLPEVVLQQAADEMLDWRNCGSSVMEVSHRGKPFMSIAAQAEADLRELLNVPEHYKVLFLQGGATAHFAMLPLNFLGDKKSADYINTGQWSTKAIKEAKKYTAVNVAASGESSNFTTIPERPTWQLDSNAAYVHIASNETIGGVEFLETPDTGDVPLVADMSSTILSRPLDVNRYGMIYAGAQKNIGPAGLCVLIIREDLLGKASPLTPTVFNYKTQAENDSMSNTPATYSWYLAGLVFQWLKAQGGLSAIAATNERKAKNLYRAIDQSDFYANPVTVAHRSWMNIPFTLADAELDSIFLQEAEAMGLQALKGHRSVGGMRASIYNAMPEAGVNALIDFMGDFERRHG